jgi:hypothetical protein
MDPYAPTSRRLDNAGSSQFSGALAHRGQANSGVDLGRQAAAIIYHLECQRGAGRINRECECGCMRLGMPRHVRQRLLGDAIARDLDGGGQRWEWVRRHHQNAQLAG